MSEMQFLDYSKPTINEVGQVADYIKANDDGTDFDGSIITLPDGMMVFGAFFPPS